MPSVIYLRSVEGADAWEYSADRSHWLPTAITGEAASEAMEWVGRLFPGSVVAVLGPTASATCGRRRSLRNRATGR